MKSDKLLPRVAAARSPPRARRRIVATYGMNRDREERPDDRERLLKRCAVATGGSRPCLAPTCLLCTADRLLPGNHGVWRSPVSANAWRTHARTWDCTRRHG